MINHEADHYLYIKLKTYTYKYPYFIYKTDNNSFIHPEHIAPFHNTSKNKIIQMYNSYYANNLLASINRAFIVG